MSNRPPLILASQSRARKTMLERAHLTFACRPAHLDEKALTEAALKKGTAPDGICLELAKAKALHVAGGNPGALVIGSDQICVLGNTMLDKARDRGEAKDKLRRMLGRDHRLISGAAVARDGEILWHTVDEAVMTMRALDDAALEWYMDAAGDALTDCVGAYEFEGPGAWLFEKAQGDFFTILGMPLLPLLGFLSREGCA